MTRRAADAVQCQCMSLQRLAASEVRHAALCKHHVSFPLTPACAEAEGCVGAGALHCAKPDRPRAGCGVAQNGDGGGHGWQRRRWV
eukprot:1156048-Pelagomonas_calceolata.AAC.6